MKFMTLRLIETDSIPNIIAKVFNTEKEAWSEQAKHVFETKVFKIKNNNDVVLMIDKGREFNSI